MTGDGTNLDKQSILQEVMPTSPAGGALVAKSGDLLVGPRGLQPENVEALWRIAAAAAASGVFPVIKGDANKSFVLMALGGELGLSPFRSLSAVHLIDGRPSLSGEAALAIIRAKGLLERGTDVQKRYSGQDDDYGCEVAITRRGQPQPFVDFYTVAEAKRAGLWQKDNWKRHPDSMLFWRAVGRIVREHFSDATMGLVLTEEMADEPREVHISAEPAQLPVLRADPLLSAIVEQVHPPQEDEQSSLPLEP